MSENSADSCLERLAAACSASARALRQAIIAVEGDAWQRRLRQAYLDRVELFEVCARCLIAAARSPRAVGELAARDLPESPVGDAEALAAVARAEHAFEAAIRALIRQPGGVDARLTALAHGQLASVRSLRRRPAGPEGRPARPAREPAGLRAASAAPAAAALR